MAALDGIRRRRQPDIIHCKKKCDMVFFAHYVAQVFLSGNCVAAWWTGRGFCYLCNGARRCGSAAGDLSLVDIGTMGELQFFLPVLHLEFFKVRGVGVVWNGSFITPSRDDYLEYFFALMLLQWRC